jgi:hypothetical protein
MKSKLIFFLLALELTSSNAQTFQVNKPSATQERVVVETVEITKDSTIITIRLDNVGQARVWPPGHDKAFFITDAKQSKRYLMLDAEGVSIAPKWSSPERFKLVFEKIPKDLTRFHLVEGNLMNAGAWNFTNIQLK